MKDADPPDSAFRDPHSELLLTATDRLARQLREDANLARSRDGVAVWEAPQIASFSRWLTDTWTASWPDAQLLSSTQELVLWREAVERDEAGAQLLAPLAAAREARRADQVIRRHAPALDSAPAWQDEHHAFRRWRQQVLRRMRQNRWLTGADLAAEVAGLIRDGAVAVPPAIRLHGFIGELAPSERAVLEALVARGTRVESEPPPAFAPRVTRQVMPDPEQQWRGVLQDIRERLRAAGDGLPPRIVIALPDPEGQRELAESTLRDLLAPWAARGDGALPWRWERGRRLAQTAQVDLLLALLQLTADDNAPDAISRILLSTSLWSEVERAHTARADLRLRQEGWPRIRLSRLAPLLPAALGDRFTAFASRLAALPSRALPSEWAAQFRELVEQLGWPGSDALDSHSYQAARAGRGLFDRLATLDAQLGRVPRSSARDWLAELARGANFSPRVEHAQPVLLTSLDEAAALSCDVLYVLDATAAQVPSLARPTPFLPLDAQRAAGVADASPEAWLARARAQVTRLLEGCAPEVFVCLPAVDARGALLQPSSLFGAASEWQRVTPQRSVSALEHALSDTEAALDWPASDIAPPVDAAEQAALRPATGLFRAWFESPFFALCRYRLGIEPLPQPAQGLDARVQGMLVHAALDGLWGELGDSASLAAIDDARLSARIDDALERPMARHLPATEYGAVTRSLERARAHDVIFQWLLHERERLDAFQVEMREVSAEPVVAGLQLRLRLDRVDRVQTPLGERWLVMDYKTGREADPRGWRADRPLEPQLPLYASHAATRAAGIPQVDGICFGHVKDGHPALVAQTSWRKKLREEPSADLQGDWDDSLASWRVAMESAARGFLAGEAWLDPKVGDRSAYADLLALTQGLAPDEGETS